MLAGDGGHLAVGIINVVILLAHFSYATANPTSQLSNHQQFNTESYKDNTCQHHPTLVCPNSKDLQQPIY